MQKIKKKQKKIEQCTKIFIYQDLKLNKCVKYVNETIDDIITTTTFIIPKRNKR